MAKHCARILSPTDAAYLAGLIDGEGTITLSRRHANERRQLVVSVVSTERSLVDWILSGLGVGKVTRKRVASTKHAPSFTYSVANRQALSVLEQTAPYLRSYKRLRAQMALQSYVALTPRNGHYTPEQAARREHFEQSFLLLKPTFPRLRT